jgi:hypothetical protein
VCVVVEHVLCLFGFAHFFHFLRVARKPEEVTIVSERKHDFRSFGKQLYNSNANDLLFEGKVHTVYLTVSTRVVPIHTQRVENIECELREAENKLTAVAERALAAAATVHSISLLSVNTSSRCLYTVSLYSLQWRHRTSRHQTQQVV